MDEIIYLEPDEEITSVIDKIKNAKSGKLGLVVPREAALLQSVVNLRLLSREAVALGKEIAIVTADKIGRNLAAQVGLEVYNSIEEQKPIYQPPPPVPAVDEVIEIDMAPQEPQEPIEDESVPGVKVQHYQDKPIDWKSGNRPILKSKPPEVIPQNPVAQPSVKQLLNKKDRGIRNLHKIIWPIVGIFIILIAIGVYLLLPKATITVFVPSEDLKKTVQLSVSDKVTQPNLEQSVLPGKLVEVTAEKEDKFTTTGKKNIGEKASGTITIYNNLDSNSHKFEAGTKLSSSSKTFITKSEVTVSGATVQNLKIVPGTVSVDIEAENPGEEYNVKAGRFSIFEIPSAEQEAIYGQSNKDLAGGMSREVQVMSTDDYNKAKDGILKELQVTVKNDLDKKIGDSVLLEKALVTPEPEIITSAKVDQEAKDFQMKVILKEQALVYENKSLTEMLTTLLQKQVESNKMVKIATPGDISLNVDKIAYDKGQMDLTAGVLAKVSAKIEAGDIKSAIVSKKVSVAQEYILSQDGVKSVQIDFKPSWWFEKIPDLGKNVEVKIEYINVEKAQ